MYEDSNVDLQVCTYDDITVTSSQGRVTLSCPACGPLTAVTVKTLSDLTNAAIEHLEGHPEAHRYASVAA